MRLHKYPSGNIYVDYQGRETRSEEWRVADLALDHAIHLVVLEDRHLAHRPLCFCLRCEVIKTQIKQGVMEVKPE